MARTAITVQKVALGGLTPSFAAADINGQYFSNDGNVLLEVKNAGAGAITVTITAVAKLAGVSLTNPAISVPLTNGDKMIGPFDPTVFNQSDGTVYVDYSGVTSVTVAAIQLPNP